MTRTLALAATTLLLLVSATIASQGGDTLLDKKEKLTEKDPGYKPGSDVDKLGDPNAQKYFQVITNNPHKVYTLKLKKGDKVVIEMKNASDDPKFDSLVIVEDSKKKVLAFNDDDPTRDTLDSRLEFTAPEDDEYRIIATVLFKKYGDFQLTVKKAK